MPNMRRILNGLEYNTECAQLIAHDRYWDGHNMERYGRNTYLYRTPSGRYFTASTTLWQGERDQLTPVSPEEARDLYENILLEHAEDYHTAFPHIVIEQA